MNNFADPAIMWALGTVLFLIIISFIVARRASIDLSRFRHDLQPGQYAKVKTEAGMIRAKLVEKNVGRLHLFESVDDKQIILTAPSNIYLP